MFISKVIKQGNSLMLTLPVKICRELTFHRNDFFSCAAVDTAVSAFRKMSAEPKPVLPSDLKGVKLNAQKAAKGRKNSHRTHRSKSRSR